MSNQNVTLKAYHHFLLKIRQLFCLHGKYVYLELTTQREPKGGKVISFATGCERCGWINMPHGGYGMPRTLRNSYDKTYLKITNKHDALLSELTRKDG